MCRKLLFAGGILLLLAGAAAAPISVRAEGGPQPTLEPLKPPWITGVNPNVSLSTIGEEELTPSGIIETWEGVEVPLLAAPPSYVDLAPQLVGEAPSAVVSLAVPQRYQDPLDVTCGAAALGMALEFLSLNGEGQAPSQDTLVSDLKNAGLLYDTGTGVEELAFLARQHGHRGTTAFRDWTLDQLGEQLGAGRPVVVSLGANGENAPGHFVTLTGISDDGKWVSYNDPILGNQTLPVDDFQKLWDLQGNSGLVARKEPLSVMDDPMLPWMGLFSALTMLAAMAKHYPLNEELNGLLAGICSILSNPLRSGFGGALVNSPGGGGNSSSPPYTAPRGYSWKKTYLSKYGWKDVTITEKVEVPNMVRRWAVVKVNRWIEKVPVYKTVRVDRGHWAYRTVKKYRTERYRTRQRYRVKKSYWYRRYGRLYRGTRYEWKTRTVWKSRRVSYYKREKYWVPNIVSEKRIDHYREIEHRDPVYGMREEQQGTKTINRTKTVRSWKPVGTQVKWELKKDPTPTPPPLNPTPTLTPVTQTSTATPLYSILGLSLTSSQTQSSTQTATPWPTGTQSATPTPTPQDPTPTPTPVVSTATAIPPYPTLGSSSTSTVEPMPTGSATPSATPDWTPRPTYDPSDFYAASTQVAEVKTGVDFVRKTGYPLLKGFSNYGWPNNYQTGGLFSGVMNGIGAIAAAQGADSSDVKKWQLAAKGSDTFYSVAFANNIFSKAQLPTAGQSISNALGSASGQSGLVNKINSVAGSLVDDAGNQLTAMSSKVVAVAPALRVLQGVGAFGGLFGGGYQISTGLSMGKNDDPYDNTLGFIQTGGGAATIAGSAFTLLGMIPAVSAAIPAVIGAAPVLLGVGAIAAGGVLAYNLLKDTKFVDNVNKGIETWADKPAGFVDTAISIGQSLVDSGVPTALAVPLAIAESAFQQVTKSVKNTIDNTIENVNHTLDTIGSAAQDWFKPLNKVIDDVSDTITSAINTITTPIKNAAASVSETIKKSTDPLIDAIDNAANGISDFFGGLFGSGN